MKCDAPCFFELFPPLNIVLNLIFVQKMKSPCSNLIFFQIKTNCMNSRCNSTIPEVFDEFSHLFICFGVKLSHWRGLQPCKCTECMSHWEQNIFKFATLLRVKQNFYDPKNLLFSVAIFWVISVMVFIVIFQFRLITKYCKPYYPIK